MPIRTRNFTDERQKASADAITEESHIHAAVRSEFVVADDSQDLLDTTKILLWLPTEMWPIM